MIHIQDLQFWDNTPENIFTRGRGSTWVSGRAQAGRGFAMATIGSFASGDMTYTISLTKTLTIDNSQLSESFAFATGKSISQERGSSSHSSARYIADYAYRY